MKVTSAERVAASVVSFPAVAMLVAYTMDAVGLTIAPTVVFIASIAAAAAVFTSLRSSTEQDPAQSLAFGAIVVGVLSYLLWIARPAFLPPGGGPDLTHHLALVDYIERHWRLVHDPALGAVLGEMADYTPGLHLLAATAGVWTRTDGLHAIYPIVALTVALKAGLVFAIAMRLLPDEAPRLPLAVAAVLLLLAPRDYFLGSFTEHSFLAQVVSELFAVAMWWALVVWNDQPAPLAMGMFAIGGVGAFLAWPVWIGPLLLVLAGVVALRRDVSRRDRMAALAIAVAPIAIVAVMHAAGRVHAVGIAATAGYVVWPSLRIFGWWFLALATVGMLIAAATPRTRSVVWLAGAIALQSAVLFVIAQRSGADRPYLALKMMYLAIYPLAVAASLPLATAARAAPQPYAAWLVVVALAVFAARPSISAPRPKPIVSEPMFLAGRWARANLPPECVDYLVGDNYSAYWLHLAVLGNARQTDRTRDNATFDAKQTLIRWIQPEGLPYAIAADFEGLPKDIRTSVDVAQRFGPAAVIKRRGPSSCSDEENRRGR